MKGTIQKMPIQMTNLNNKNTRIIIGNPGCGKTTRLIAELQKVYKAGTPLSRIAFSSFSVASIEEATERAIISLQNDAQKDKIFLPYFKTLHAMAFQMLGLDANSLLTTQQLKEFASLQGIKVTGVDKRIGLPHRMTSGDKIMQIINVANLYDMPIRQYMIAQDIHEFPVKFVEDIAMRYRDFKIATSLYDYTDMLIMAKNRDLALPELDYLFIDEAQDLSTLQWILVNRMASKAGHIIVAGDDKQCQPPGSKVLTTKGFKNIEDLDEDRDRLISYAKRNAMCYGGYSFKKKAHIYDGYMYNLHTKAGTIKTTRNHINLVKWNSKDTSKNVVYLMQRGEYFRIGWCQLFNSNGGLHLGERSNKEKADRTWILRVCNSKQEASKYESILAGKYGLPLIPFEPPHNAYYYTKEVIDEIFKSIPCQKDRAARLLDDLNKSLADPLLQKGKQNRHGATIFECPSLNLEEGLMKLPVMKDKKHIEWIPIDEIFLTEYTGTVYGLDVEKYHTYITDNNIITHNCINEFAGADVDTFLSLPGKVEVLKQSYRIPKTVYQKANKLMQQMVKFRKEGSNWLPRKEGEGVVKTITSIPLAEIAQGNWLILARGGYQLNSLKEQLFACEAGKKPILFTLNGAPPIDMEAYRAVYLFKMYETLDGFQDLVILKDTDTAEIRKQKLDYIALFKKFMNVPLDNMQPWEISEKIKHKLTLSWFEALDKLTLIERRYIKHTYKYYVKKGNDMFKDTPVKLMTIHAAKGREADNVLVYLNVPRTVEESLCLKDTDIEIKTLYVAITRAKKKLLLYLPKRQRFSYANLL